MKTIKLLSAFLICFGTMPYQSIAQQAEPDSILLPGANFSLEGALEMFKKSNSPEEFEMLLNAEDNKVNNLDLNEDGTIDYIKVINRKEDEVFIFVLRAVVSATEEQDIAVIELEKNGLASALIQIVGDEDIYGEETIVEPSDEGAASADADLNPSDNEDNNTAFFSSHGPNISFYTGEAASGNYAGVQSVATIIVNVWAWPSVRFVYAPGYRAWISPWSWNTRPRWWSPRRPLGWTAYRPFHYQYRHRYVIVRTRRVAKASVIYRPARVTSVTVRTRNQVAVNHYRKTHKSGTVTVNRGNRQFKATRKTTTIKGPKGIVKKNTTVVRRKR